MNIEQLASCRPRFGCLTLDMIVFLQNWSKLGARWSKTVVSVQSHMVLGVREHSGKLFSFCLLFSPPIILFFLKRFPTLSLVVATCVHSFASHVLGVSSAIPGGRPGVRGSAVVVMRVKGSAAGLAVICSDCVVTNERTLGRSSCIGQPAAGTHAI